MDVGDAARARGLGWLVAAWVAPAALAGLAGWTGIWGTGSAFFDYLVPAPIAGGALHVPSFLVLAGLVIGVGAGRDRWLARGAAPGLAIALLGVGLVAGLLLVDLERIRLALASDLPLRLRVERNPLALFVCSDALAALVWLRGWRAGPRLAWALLAPLALVVLLVLDAPGREEIRRGHVLPGRNRGDVTRWAWTPRRPLEALEPAALEYARALDPAQSANAEDVAIHFTDSLEGAQRAEMADVFATLCLYEDGTPTRFGAGTLDCFAHESFTERSIAGRVDLDEACPALLAAFPPERSRALERADLDACRAWERRLSP